jgi:hypothetical protein
VWNLSGRNCIFCNSIQYLYSTVNKEWQWLSFQWFIFIYLFIYLYIYLLVNFKYMCQLLELHMSNKEWQDNMHATKAYGEVELRAPVILNAGTRLKWMVSFMCRPLYPVGKDPSARIWDLVSQSEEEINVLQMVGIKLPFHGFPTHCLVTLLTLLSQLST